MPQRRGCQAGGRSLRRTPGLIVGVVAGLMLAAPASAQTLPEAFAYAYNTNPQLLAQRALLRATDETVPQALSNWRPTVTLTGQSGYNRVGTEAPNFRGAATPTQFFSFVSRSVDLNITQ